MNELIKMLKSAYRHTNKLSASFQTEHIIIIVIIIIIIIIIYLLLLLLLFIIVFIHSVVVIYWFTSYQQATSRSFSRQASTVQLMFTIPNPSVPDVNSTFQDFIEFANSRCTFSDVLNICRHRMIQEWGTIS